MALTFAEPAAAQVVAQLGNDDLVAPPLLWHEMANVCLTKMRAHPTEREQLLTAFRMAARLDLHVVDAGRAAGVSPSAKMGY